MQTRPVVRIGHRGAAGSAPENTIAAIRRGIELGADFVEIDIQRTRDGELVLMHDELLDRTTDGRGLVRDVNWCELQKLRTGCGERVPTLAMALAETSGRVGIMLEIKASGAGREIYTRVIQTPFSGPVIYASFLHEEVREIRQIDRLARTLALIEPPQQVTAAAAARLGADLVGLPEEAVSAESVRQFQTAGLQVWVYTVNDVQNIHRFVAMGVDGVISDYPELVPKLTGLP